MMTEAVFDDILHTAAHVYYDVEDAGMREGILFLAGLLLMPEVETIHAEKLLRHAFAGVVC